MRGPLSLSTPRTKTCPWGPRLEVAGVIFDLPALLGADLGARLSTTSAGPFGIAQLIDMLLHRQFVEVLQIAPTARFPHTARCFSCSCAAINDSNIALSDAASSGSFTGCNAAVFTSI
jgi:hypothetical protein